MKTIILCGGKGTRLKEETEFKPKAMVAIGGRPILWHIMKTYTHHGFNNFVTALGYKGEMIVDYFTKNNPERFNIIFSDTGLESATGERILRARSHITEDDFMVTYGDGVSDIDIKKLVEFHRKQGTIGTITGVKPRSKYGLITIDHKTSLVCGFKQKPIINEYVSGGFMVFKRAAFDYFDAGDMENAFEKLVKANQLSVYLHDSFWKAMDTYYEMEELNKLWENERPWAVWEKDNTHPILES